MTTGHRGLADLHLHLYGSIHWQQFLDYIWDRSVGWTSYENAFLEAYGQQPPIRESWTVAVPWICQTKGSSVYKLPLLS